jgi:serine/threonine-protein kinase
MPEPHQQIGDYEIVRELGHGGMGQVYLVRNLISDRIEAMKVLLPDLAQQGDLANRFMREIKVLASLDHPNIAQLRTAFTAENQLVMIMEYVEGDTLAERLQAGPFSAPDALNYIAQVLTALSYAHGKGVIHRDIKPSNMMLTPKGVVKLMDFGIARSTQDLGMTVTGTTLGSLDYMSPEQVKSEPTDARSDLYSVGVSLYEMVTGHHMFSATSSYSVMEAHVKEIPRPPIEVVPTLPKALSDIIMMAVAKDPGHRFQTADAMRNALSQVGGATAAAAAVVAAPQAVVTPAPQPTPQPMPVTPPPAAPAPSTFPAQEQQACAVLEPRPTKSGGRHIGWIVVAAIVILVALFGGTEVYRSHKQAPAMESAAVPSAGSAATAPAATPVTPAPASTTPATPEAQPAPAPAAAPTPAPPPAPGRHGQQGTQQANMAPPPPPGPSPEEIAAQKKLLDDMENEMDHLDSRAAAVESSLGALEQQQHQSGYGLRGDMVSARANMRTDMSKAKDALQSADTDRARKYLDMASHEIEKLEAFVGRR